MKIASLLRSSRRRASPHGLASLGSAPTRAGALAAVSLIASGSRFRAGLLDPRLCDEPVELLAEREVADTLRDEVDVLRVEEGHHRRLVRHLAIDLRPHRVRALLV